MEIFVFMIVMSIIGVIVQVTVQNHYAKIVKDKYKAFKERLENKYGSPSTEIFPIPDYVNTRCSILVFPDSEKIVIDACTYDFSDIMDFSVNEEKSYKSSTSTGSAIGRGIVGGVLLGGVGALAGAATAKKNTMEKVDSYTIRVILNGFNNPDVIVNTSLKNIMGQITSVLKKIIDYNDRKSDI